MYLITNCHLRGSIIFLAIVLNCLKIFIVQSNKIFAYKKQNRK